MIEAELFESRATWRAWLRRNHKTSKALWLIFYKKKHDAGTLQYEAAVEEALCYGWIDSILKRIDDKTHKIKFTPRKAKSNWSRSNKERVAKLTRQRRMTKAGLALVEVAKQNGSWDQLQDFDENPTVPPELRRALNKDKEAKAAFDRMAPSHRKQYLWWIGQAKREETRLRRIGETVKRVKAGRQAGM